MHPHPDTAPAPTSLDTALSALRHKGFAQGIVATTHASPQPTVSERVLVYSRNGDALSPVLDIWIAQEDFAPLLAALGTIGVVWAGSSDATTQDAPEYVWAQGRDELHLWRNGALIGRFARGLCHLRKPIMHTWFAVASQEMDSVHAFLSPDWTKRGVRLERRSGPSVDVARKKTLAPLFAPTYDGIDLLCDSLWVIELTRAVSAATAIPARFDQDFGPCAS